MENKGLCITCVYEKECILTKKFPVLQCEEFSTEPETKCESDIKKKEAEESCSKTQSKE